MSRLTAPARLAALVVALIVPMLAWTAPAHADDPKPDTVTLHVSGGTLEEDTTIELTAQADAYPVHPTGTFTYSDDEGTIVGTGEALEGGGTYPITVPKPSRPTTYTVEYHSTNGFADGSASVLFTPTYIKTVTVDPEPTILKLGTGLLPQLTLTLAATAKLKDGTGVPGVKVNFYAFCPPGPSRTCTLSVPLCSALTDANGLATCKGAGAFGALLSILSGVVSFSSYPFTPEAQQYNYVSTHGIQIIA